MRNLLIVSALFGVWAMLDSNQRPPACKEYFALSILLIVREITKMQFHFACVMQVLPYVNELVLLFLQLRYFCFQLRYLL